MQQQVDYLRYLDSFSDEMIYQNYMSHWTIQFSPRELASLTPEDRATIAALRARGASLQ